MAAFYCVVSNCDVEGRHIFSGNPSIPPLAFCPASVFSAAQVLLASLHLTSVVIHQCQLRDYAPTVARTTTRPSMIRQRFSRRVRRYPVSFGRRILRRSAHPPRSPTTNPDNTRATRRARSPATRHSYSPSTLLHAPVHRSDPSARGDLRARPADDSAALGTLQHPRLPDVDEAWPEAWAS